MAHMNSTGLPWLFHRHTLGIDGDRGAGGSGRLLRRSGASPADLFDQCLDRFIGGRKGTLSLQAGLQPVSQIQPMLPGSRGQSAERADDALTGTLGGVQRLDEEVVGVGLALVGLACFAEIHRTLHISSTAFMSTQISHLFVTIYDFRQPFVETRRLVCPISEKSTLGRGSRVSPAQLRKYISFESSSRKSRCPELCQHCVKAVSVLAIEVSFGAKQSFTNRLQFCH